MKLLCFTVPKMSERCRANVGAGWNHECFQWSIAGNPSAGTVVPCGWLRNPAPPKGWFFNPINNGMCTISQLMIGISQPSKVSRLTVGFLVYIYVDSVRCFFWIATYNFWGTILCRRHIFAGRGVLVLESHDGAP